MITFTELCAAYALGIVRLMLSPLDDGIVCAIGDDWLYFDNGNLNACDFSDPQIFRAFASDRAILANIYTTLCEFLSPNDTTFRDEGIYCATYIGEQLRKIGLEVHDGIRKAAQS